MGEDEETSIGTAFLEEQGKIKWTEKSKLLAKYTSSRNLSK
jgi:hypothetical protein